MPRRERRPRPLVVGAEHQRRQDLPAEPGGADTVTRIARAVVDARSRLRAEEGEVVGRDVDRSAPRPLDADAREAGEQASQARLRASGRWPIERETVVDPPSEADWAAAAAHEHAPVPCRAEVVEEHASVDDRL